MVQRTGGFGKRNTSPDGAAPKRLQRPTDKRQGIRAPSFRYAKVYISGNTELECAVRDVSQSGCMVSLLGAENLPDELSVRLDPSQPRRKARVAWRENLEAGLEFLPEEGV